MSLDSWRELSLRVLGPAGGWVFGRVLTLHPKTLDPGQVLAVPPADTRDCSLCIKPSRPPSLRLPSIGHNYPSPKWLCQFDLLSMYLSIRYPPARGRHAPLTDRPTRRCAGAPRKYDAGVHRLSFSTRCCWVAWPAIRAAPRAHPRREPAPYFVGPRCVFVRVCVCLCVYCRVGASCGASPCVCRVVTPPARLIYI